VRHSTARTPTLSVLPEILQKISPSEPFLLSDIQETSMKLASFKVPAKALVPALAALTMLSPGVQAESTYGYRAAGGAGPTARARVDFEVRVPMLILLRVGSSGSTIDKITISAGPSGGIPGGLTALSNGNNRASDWDGSAPILGGTATPASLTSYAWTNSVGGGSVTGVLTGLNTGGLTGASIEVASAPSIGGGLAHPGATLAAFSPVAFGPNTLVSSTWTYSLSAAAISSVTAGVHTGRVTYTATSL
jgi:hypothetical protein